MDSGAFTKKDSLIIKGVAILMMIWHHCFYPGWFEGFSIQFWPLTASQVSNIAWFCKTCVSLFAFVSGYGLYLSFQKAKPSGEKTNLWLIKHMIKTLSNYWFIMILAWVACTIIDQRPYHVYGFENSVLTGIWNMGIDFLGLSNLTGTPLLNGNGWYISAALVFIVLLPVLCSAMEKFGCLCTVGTILILPRMINGFPGGLQFLSFLPVFCFGMIFAKCDLFSRWKAQLKKRPWGNAVAFLALMVLQAVTYKLFHRIPLELFWDIQWNFIPIVTILLAYTLTRLIPKLGNALAFFGTHATNIWLIHWLIHWLIRDTYCTRFTYSMGHFALVIAVLFLISLLLSAAVEMLKRVTRYPILIERALEKLENIRI